MAGHFQPLYVHRFWLLVHQKNYMVLALIFSLVVGLGNYLMDQRTHDIKVAYTEMIQAMMPTSPMARPMSAAQPRRLPAAVEESAAGATIQAAPPPTAQDARAKLQAQFKQLVAHPSQIVTLALLWLALVVINQTTFWWGFKHGALNITSFQRASMKEIISLMVGVFLGTLLSIIALAVLGLSIFLFKSFNLPSIVIFIFVLLGFFIFLRWWYAAFATMAISGKAGAIFSLGQWKDAFKTLKTMNLLKIAGTQAWSGLVVAFYTAIILAVAGIILKVAGAFGPPQLAEFGTSALATWLGITGMTAVGYYLGQAYFRMIMTPGQTGRESSADATMAS